MQNLIFKYNRKLGDQDLTIYSSFLNLQFDLQSSFLAFEFKNSADPQTYAIKITQINTNNCRVYP